MLLGSSAWSLHGLEYKNELVVRIFINYMRYMIIVRILKSLLIDHANSLTGMCSAGMMFRTCGADSALVTTGYNRLESEEITISMWN